MARPRQFDEQQILQKVTQLFWDKGYAETSLSDLCAATKLNRPSLYGAFGNKETIFLKCLEAYRENEFPKILEGVQIEKRGLAKIRRMIRNYSAFLTDCSQPCGCLVVSCQHHRNALPECVQSYLEKIHADFIGMIEQHFQEAIEAGELPDDTDAHHAATCLVAQLYGLVVLSSLERASVPAVAEEIVEGLSVSIPDLEPT